VVAKRLGESASHVKCAVEAGIRYGLYGIPQAWREALRGQELLTRFAARIGRTSRNREGTHISDYLMHRYNQIRPHQFNDGLPPAIAEKT
jgi:putative transposase